MALKEKIEADLTEAMRSGQAEKTGVLRFALAQLQNREIEKRGTGQAPMLTDDEVIEALQKEVKKRKEAIELFQKGGRPELVEKETRELAFIEQYLPAPISKAEVETVVDALKKEGLSDFNSLMKEAMKRLRGRADGKLVSEVVRSKL
jgi:uncharacterized protein YqeY